MFRFILFVVLSLQLIGCSQERHKRVITALTFNQSPKEIEEICARERDKLLGALGTVAATRPDESTFSSAVLATELATTEFANRVNPVLFLKQVSTDAAVRAAADRCENIVNELFVEIFAR